MGTLLVSVVIVTWNRRADVLQAVQSIRNQGYRPTEVIVVDNASTDGTVAALELAYPEVRIIALERNLGASGGRNPGMRAAQGEIVCLLDSDASLGHDTLAQAVSRLEAAPDVGVVACKVVNASTGELDPRAGWIYSEQDKVDQNSEFLSYSFSECGVVLRREALDRAGLFADWLFFGREGEELSLRIWDAGYKIVYCPQAVVYHRLSPDMRVDGNRRQHYDIRNSLLVYLVRYPWWMAIGFVPLKVGASLVKGIRKHCLSEVLRALIDVSGHLADLGDLRRPIRDETARQYLGLLRAHGPLRWDLASWLKHKA